MLQDLKVEIQGDFPSPGGDWSLVKSIFLKKWSVTIPHPDSTKLKIPGDGKSEDGKSVWISTFRSCNFFLVGDA